MSDPIPTLARLLRRLSAAADRCVRLPEEKGLPEEEASREERRSRDRPGAALAAPAAPPAALGLAFWIGDAGAVVAGEGELGGSGAVWWSFCDCECNSVCGRTFELMLGERGAVGRGEGRMGLRGRGRLGAWRGEEKSSSGVSPLAEAPRDWGRAPR